MKFSFLKLTAWDYLGIILCSIPAFYLLSTPAIYVWDEALYVNASWDMAHGGSWLLPEQKEYNTKPPLVLWMQVLALKVFPSTEFAVRIPSALSVTGILLMLASALKRWGFDQWTRIIAMFAFVCHQGFIRHHISRTGDLDAVMTLFVTGYSLVALDALVFQRWSKRHNLIFFLFVILSFYAKSIGGWLMLGPLGLLLLLSPIRKLWVTIQFWAGAMLTVFICLFYYFLRESVQPGYLSLTWFSEYMRMFANVMPWHEQPFHFYFRNFVTLRFFTPWIYLLIPAVGYALFFLKDQTVKRHVINLVILSCGYLVLISVPAVKLEWYDAPVYPFFALIIGVIAGYVLREIPSGWKLVWLAPLGLMWWLKMDFIRKDIEPRHAFEHEGTILRQAEVTSQTKVVMPVLVPEHRLQLDFYTKVKKEETGISILVLDSIQQAAIGDHIIIRQELAHQLSSLKLDTLKKWDGVGYEFVVLPE